MAEVAEVIIGLIARRALLTVCFPCALTILYDYPNVSSNGLNMLVAIRAGSGLGSSGKRSVAEVAGLWLQAGGEPRHTGAYLARFRTLRYV